MKREMYNVKGENKKNSLTSHFSRLTSQDGIALMMVLWVLVLLGVLALNHLKSTRWNTAGARNLKEETIGYYIALSGYNEAVRYLMSDKDASVDYQDDAGSYMVDKDTPSVTGRRTTAEGEVDIRITDEDSRININTASPEALRSLFTHAGLAEDRVSEIVDSILDWKDQDREHHLNGAEDEYYERLEEPYKAKSALFDVPEELLLVKGITPELMYGGKDIKAVFPLITTFGGGALNINTVSKDFMTYMGLNEYEIEAVMKQRNAVAGGFRSVPPQFAERGFNAVASGNLMIEVTGKAHKSSLTSRIVAVVNRKPAGKGFRVQTIYWKEYAENSGG